MTSVVSKKDILLKVSCFAGILFLVIAVLPFMGATGINVKNVFDFSKPFSVNTDAAIFFKLRLPRTILSVITGGSLALAGLVFQALLRNSLATPFTLGISSGSALGAVIAIHLGLTATFGGMAVLPLFAFAGASCVMGLVYMLARKKRKLPTLTLLLAGVTINFFMSAIILFIQYITDFTRVFYMVRWLMGGLDIIDYRILYYIGPLTLAGFLVLLTISRHLNLISFGEEFAVTKGVNVYRIQKIAYITASFLTAVVVSVAGPIGFIGLVVPHALRISYGPDHRLLIPLSFLAGGCFLAICDTFARIVISPAELPVGVVTAMLGGPFFLWLLKQDKYKVVV